MRSNGHTAWHLGSVRQTCRAANQGRNSNFALPSRSEFRLCSPTKVDSRGLGWCFVAAPSRMRRQPENPRHPPELREHLRDVLLDAAVPSADGPSLHFLLLRVVFCAKAQARTHSSGMFPDSVRRVRALSSASLTEHALLCGIHNIAGPAEAILIFSHTNCTHCCLKCHNTSSFVSHLGNTPCEQVEHALLTLGVFVQAPQRDAGQGMDTLCRPSRVLGPGLLSNA